MNDISFFIDREGLTWAVAGIRKKQGASILIHHYGEVWLQIKKYDNDSVRVFTVTFIDGELYNPCNDESYAPSYKGIEGEGISAAIDSLVEGTVDEYKFTESFENLFTDLVMVDVECYALLDYEALPISLPMVRKFGTYRKNR